MVSIFEHLQSNTIVWFILAICTMLGIPSLVFAIIALKKDDKVQGFACLKKSNSIVSINQKRVKKLEVLFDNKPVDNTVITCISIWNSGNKTIRKEDIASRGPLTIVTNNGSEILDAYIIYESDPTYCFNISTVSNNSVVLDFEYVDLCLSSKKCIKGAPKST